MDTGYDTFGESKQSLLPHDQDENQQIIEPVKIPASVQTPLDRRQRRRDRNSEPTEPPLCVSISHGKCHSSDWLEDQIEVEIPGAADVEQGSSQPVILWRDFDAASLDVAGYIVTEYIQQSDLIIVSVNTEEQSYYGVTSEIDRRLEEIKDTVDAGNSMTWRENPKTTILVLIWHNHRESDTTDTGKHVRYAEETLTSKLRMSNSLFKVRTCETDNKQHFIGIIQQELPGLLQLGEISDPQNRQKMKIDYLRSSSWRSMLLEDLSSCADHTLHKGVSFMNFRGTSDLKISFKPSYFLSALISSLFVSLPWSLTYWLYLPLFDCSQGNNPDGQHGRCRCRCRRQFCCRPLGEKKFCPIPVIRRRRTFWGKDKSFYAVSIFIMKPIKWFNSGFLDYIKRSIQRRFPKCSQVDGLTSVAYGILAAGWNYFFPYSLFTGVLLSRLIIPLFDVPNFPLVEVHASLQYFGYFLFGALAYSFWAASSSTSSMDAIVKDATPIFVNRKRSSSTSNCNLVNHLTACALANRAATDVQIGNVLGLDTVSTEVLSNYLKEESHQLQAKSCGIALLGAVCGSIVHGVISFLIADMVNQVEGPSKRPYHFSDIPGFTVPYLVAVSAIFGTSIFFICFVLVDPIVKQNFFMEKLTHFLDFAENDCPFHDDFEPSQPINSGDENTCLKNENCRDPCLTRHCCGLRFALLRKYFNKREDTHQDWFFPFLSTNLYGWLRMRQSLIQQPRASFAEQKYFILYLGVSILFTILGYIYLWIQHGSLFTKGTILTDAVCLGFTLLGSARYAITLEDADNHHARLLTRIKLKTHQLKDDGDIGDDQAVSAAFSRLDSTCETILSYIKAEPVAASIGRLRLTRRFVNSCLTVLASMTIPVVRAVVNKLT